MKKITVLMAAILAVVTTITAGLTALPGSVQEAQTDLCTDNSVLQFPTDQGTFGETESDIECEVTAGSIEVPAGSARACSANDVEHGPTNEATAGDADSNIECEFRVGSVETD
jgi:hypothetical protein